MRHERRAGPSTMPETEAGDPQSRDPRWGVDRDRLLRRIPRLGGVDAARCRGPCRRPDRGMGNRQSVQHRDGGVVSAIHVREGQHVRAGEVLVELSAPELKASERALTSDYLTLLAQRARLMAERAASAICRAARIRDVPAEDRELATAGACAPAIGNAGPVRIGFGPAVGPRRTRGQLLQQQGGYVKQRESLVGQQELIQQELDGLMSVAAKGYASINRVRQLQRAQADLQGPNPIHHPAQPKGIGKTQIPYANLTPPPPEADLKETPTNSEIYKTRGHTATSALLSPYNPKVVASNDAAMFCVLVASSSRLFLVSRPSAEIITYSHSTHR